VGRGPLDEEAIRLLEAGNPDVEFDWTRILKGQGSATESEPDVRRERRERPRNERRREAAPPRTEAAEIQVEPELAPPAAADEPTTAAHARLGSEGLARLRARYSELLMRIDERVPAAECDELKSMAERLNPDAWVTEADVAAGLESYESTFASLRAAIGPRRKPETSAPASDQGE
jgi:hypothetical protein